MSQSVNKSKFIIDGESRGGVQALKKFSRQLGTAERDMRSFGTSAAGSIGSIGNMFTNLSFVVSTAAIGMAYGFTRIIKDSIDTAEHIQKMSQRIGISAESLSTLRYAAQLSGTELSVFEKAVQRLSRNVYDASRGIGDAKDAFEELGVQVVDENGNLLDADTIIKKVADRFAAMKDGTKKTAFALDIFGRAGADLIPMLNAGAIGLEKMQTEARNLGIEISTQTAQDAADFKDTVLALETALHGVATEVTTKILPTLNNISKWMLDNKGVFGKFIADTIKEFAVLQHVMTDPSLAKTFDFLMYGFTMDLPQKEIKGTAEELKNLKDGIQYIVDSEGNLIPIIIKNKDDINDTENDLNELSNAELKAAEAAKKLEEQWLRVNKRMESDMARNQLSKVDFELYKINQKVAELKQKFGDRDIIEEWAKSMRDAILSVGNPEVITDTYLPDNHSQYFNQYPVEYDTSLYDFQREQITSVTDWDLMNLALRQDATREMFMNMTDAAYLFYQNSGEQNKAAFKLYKAFAIAETSISTYQAAVDAYKSLVGIPIVGPTLAVAAAGAATAFGMAKIGQISSMQPNGRATSGNIPSAPTLPAGNTINESNQEIIVNVYSNYQDPDEMGRNLIPYIRKAIADGA